MLRIALQVENENSYGNRKVSVKVCTGETDLRSPLLGHCIGDTLQGDRPALLPGKSVFRSGGLVVNAWFPSIDDVCRLEMREIVEPKASCFRLTVSELPRLNDLVWLADIRRKIADGVLYADFRDWGR